MTQGQKLRRARLSLPGDLSQSALDIQLGFDAKSGRTNKYENGPGPRGFSAEYKDAWTRTFGHIIPWSYIESLDDTWPFASQNAPREEDLEPTPDVDDADLDESHKLPYHGDVPAGDFEEDETFRPRYEPVPIELHHPDRFIRRISGDSMAPALRFGDTAIFHKSTRPRDGVIVIAQNGSGRTVKVARYRAKERIWVLEAFNKDFEWPITDWEMIGYLVAIRRIGPSGLRETYDSEQGIKPEMMPVDPER